MTGAGNGGVDRPGPPRSAPGSQTGQHPALLDTATTSYEQARDELAEIVRRLEAGSATLEESLALWERGEQLAAVCQQWLDGARDRLRAAIDDDR